MKLKFSGSHSQLNTFNEVMLKQMDYGLNHDFSYQDNGTIEIELENSIDLERVRELSKTNLLTEIR